MPLYVYKLDTGETIKVRKYLCHSDGQESIWSDDWYGRHVIGQDCDFLISVKDV